MARDTITGLKAEVEKRDQEIGRLNALLAESQIRHAETAAALRLMKTLAEDALK